MVGVGRDICGLSSPTLLPKQGHLQQAAQDRMQAGLEYLQRRRLHNLSGQPGPGLRHPQREEVLPHVQTELPVLQFVPIAPCPVAGHYWKELGPILLTPTLEIFVSIYYVPNIIRQESLKLFSCTLPRLLDFINSLPCSRSDPSRHLNPFKSWHSISFRFLQHLRYRPAAEKTRSKQHFAKAPFSISLYTAAERRWSLSETRVLADRLAVTWA